MAGKKQDGGFSSAEMFLKGTAVALLVTIPSLAAFGASWGLLDDLIQAAVIGGVVHLIAMILSFKIAKKLFFRRAG